MSEPVAGGALRRGDDWGGTVRRFGPLHRVGSRLLVGDPGRRHVSLRRAGLEYWDGSRTVDTYPWDALEWVSLALPTRRFRFPGLVSGLLSTIAIALITDDPGLSPADGEVTVRTRDDEVSVPVSTHHMGGYWDRSVESAQRLLDRLVAEPSSRALLDHPDALIRSAALAAKQ